MAPDLNRRDFMKAAGTAGIAGLAGCNSLGEENTDTEDRETDTSTDTATDTPQDPTYDIRVSALEYDLTNLATSETNQHDQAYVEDNYSAELGVTVLENGEETGLEELGDVHLENEEGEEVETTEEGYVPEYAVSDGEELTVRAEIDGETKEETVTVSKELPSEFYADAKIQEDGEVLYDTDWSTPYSFDNHIVDRQAFLDQRAERRNELADDQIFTESDLEQFKEGNQEYRNEGHGEEELIEYILRGIGVSITGSGERWEGSEAKMNSFNVEKALEEHTDFDPNYVGSFWNPREPDVPTSADSDGLRVKSQIAHVGDDWFHNGEDNVLTSAHISEVDEIEMAKDVEDEPAQYLAVSVLGEFERGNTDIDNPDDASYFVQEAVTSPVTLNDDLAELELSEDISWNALNQIRENTEWEDVMIPMELATALGTNLDGSVEMEGESTTDSRIKVTR
jgi:hypothetical protein